MVAQFHGHDTMCANIYCSFNIFFSLQFSTFFFPFYILSEDFSRFNASVCHLFWVILNWERLAVMVKIRKFPRWSTKTQKENSYGFSRAENEIFKAPSGRAIRFVEIYSPETVRYNKMYFMNSLWSACHHFVHM